MWEDKGPSFTKMTRGQYNLAGVSELENIQFYQEIQGDPSVGVKSKCDKLVQNMCSRGEITEKYQSLYRVVRPRCPISIIYSKPTKSH